ncbi:hypothetical protein COLO4_22079 [Corchorus olitorius]|uniref:AP complex mu/sigma subunit domain-containing protein n=1 Tax=Corchorus olitorius TaxID=93759 RepID=A0A1R3IP99_9ROSI|nr:hypothetical protein COLO4_22079 [Corchorus olitorius]
MVMNTQGKPRLAKFYEYLVNFCFSFETFNFFLKYFTLLRSFPFGNEDLDLINLFKFFCKNRRGSEFPIELATGEATRAYTKRFCSRAENVSNFIQAESIFGPDSRLVYKHFATLYFVLVFDSSENELAVLDLIQDLNYQMLGVV